MADPSLELQGALVTALKADPNVSALIADRVYDRAPEGAVFPFVQIGLFQTLEDGAECINGTEVFADLHVWSRSVGQVEAKRIASEIHSLFHDSDLTLASFTVVDFRHRTTRLMSNDDGETTHAVVTFRLLIDEL